MCVRMCGFCNVWVCDVCICGCMNGIFNVWLCVGVGFEICGYVHVWVL
jgi:hypothetical protein